MTRRILARIAASAVAGIALSPAFAALDIGDPVPKFTATAALGGKTFNYSLADALAKGPVVVYFFPAAGTTDCNIEAHAFAEAMGQFEARRRVGDRRLGRRYRHAEGFLGQAVPEQVPGGGRPRRRS